MGTSIGMLLVVICLWFQRLTRWRLASASLEVAACWLLAKGEKKYHHFMDHTIRKIGNTLANLDLVEECS